MPRHARQYTLGVRLSDNERKLTEKAAIKRDQTLSEYFRGVAVGMARRELNRGDIDSLGGLTD